MYHIQLLMARNLAELISLIAGSYLSIWGRIATPVMEILIQRDTKTFYLFLCLSGGLSDVWETHKTWVGSSALFKQAASLPPALTSVIWKFGCLHVCITCKMLKSSWINQYALAHAQRSAIFTAPNRQTEAMTNSLLQHSHQVRNDVEFTFLWSILSSCKHLSKRHVFLQCHHGIASVETPGSSDLSRPDLPRIWISAQKLHDNSQVASCGIRHG